MIRGVVALLLEAPPARPLISSIPRLDECVVHIASAPLRDKSSHDRRHSANVVLWKLATTPLVKRTSNLGERAKGSNGPHLPAERRWADRSLQFHTTTCFSTRSLPVVLIAGIGLKGRLSTDPGAGALSSTCSPHHSCATCPQRKSWKRIVMLTVEDGTGDTGSHHSIDISCPSPHHRACSRKR